MFSGQNVHTDEQTRKDVLGPCRSSSRNVYRLNVSNHSSIRFDIDWDQNVYTYGAMLCLSKSSCRRSRRSLDFAIEDIRSFVWEK
jgi:hypothetical protein